eukprot:6130280-Amphidinium_carterae.2
MTQVDCPVLAPCLGNNAAKRIHHADLTGRFALVMSRNTRSLCFRSDFPACGPVAPSSVFLYFYLVTYSLLAYSFDRATCASHSFLRLNLGGSHGVRKQQQLQQQQSAHQNMRSESA